MIEQSPEHVFPRSIGGDGLVIGVHPECNGRANSSIDNRLVQCGHLRAARAAVGLVSHRTGSPYEEKLTGEVLFMVRPHAGAECDRGDDEGLLELFRSSEPYGVPGTKVQVGRRADELTTRLLPNRIRSGEGVFESYKTVDAHVGETEGVDPYTVLVLAAVRRRCLHPTGTWHRFTAKVGIALIHVLGRSSVLLDDGFPVREILTSNGFATLGGVLREIAFGPGTRKDIASEPFATDENDQPRPLHITGLADHSGTAVLAVRLFDSLNHRISIPGVQVQRPVQLSIDVTVAHGAPAK